MPFGSAADLWLKRYRRRSIKIHYYKTKRSEAEL